MAKQEIPSDALTSAQLAESLGVSVNKIKKVIQELNIQPDFKRGVCGYYAPETVKKIKSKL
ncbi:MAG: hypothetical protein N2319_06620 [Candidatus Kapabacteria bacterium]|nr:hypothetical protein [Candidatus Kapabacteria bacterium]